MPDGEVGDPCYFEQVGALVVDERFLLGKTQD